MSEKINLIAFGTFGNPNGFKQSFFAGNKSLGKHVKTFDLKTDAIKLFPESVVYSIRKEHVNGHNIIAYTIYTYAKEQNSDRGGTFIGSSIQYVDVIADEGITINCLNEFHEILVNKNVQNDVITVSHSNDFSVNKPKDFDKIAHNIRRNEDLNFLQSSNSDLVVYSVTEPHALQELFKKALDLLNIYDTIYFTSSNQVAEFVYHKGIFKLVQQDAFNQELLSLQESRKQNLLATILEFDNERLRLPEDKRKYLEAYTAQLRQNESDHQHNQKKIETARGNLQKIDQKYEEYRKQIEDAITKLKSGAKLETIKQISNQNRRNFIDNIEQYKSPGLLSSISQPNINTGLTQRYEVNPNEYTQSHNTNDRQKNVELSLDWYKILCFILIPLWIGTLVYFLYIKETQPTKAGVGNISDTLEKTIQQVNEEPPKVQEVETVPALAPKPDKELKEKQYTAVEEKLKKGIGVNKVVEIIFMTHPFIKRAYVHQEKAYAKYLIEINKDSFTDTTLIKEILKRIPYDNKTK